MKTTQRFVLAASALLMATSQAVSAQNAPSELKVLAEDVSPGGKACGLSSERNSAAIRAAMRYNRIPETKERTGQTTVYFETHAISGKLGCFAMVQVRIRKFTEGNVPGIGTVFGELTFCEQGALLSGGDLPARVDLGLKRLFDACLQQMVDNKMG